MGHFGEDLMMEALGNLGPMTKGNSSHENLFISLRLVVKCNTPSKRHQLKIYDNFYGFCRTVTLGEDVEEAWVSSCLGPRFPTLILVQLVG